MNTTRSSAAAAAAAILALAGCGGSSRDPSPAGATASASHGADAASAALRRDEGEGVYVQRNLVSDGFVPAEHPDANLVNGWGIARLPTSPWWVANNGTATSTLYTGDGVAQALVVNVVGAGGARAAPTGMVANPTTSFVVAGGGGSGPARFIFASEDGTISAWNPGVPPPVPPATRSTVSTVMVTTAGAIYKGLAIASTSAGDRLYATDFHGARVAVFDGAWAPVVTPGAFVDPGIPAGFAPFGIQEAGGTIYVTYAKQDADAADEIAGKHLGYVSAFSTDGAFLRRIASGGKLDAPWGVALAPATGFGRASGKLLVGNFGDGHIIAYRLSGKDRSEQGGSYLSGRDGRITIDGLWGLGFGNDSAAGPSNVLFFAAGPDDEAHGLFGRIDFVPGEGEHEREQDDD